MPPNGTGIQNRIQRYNSIMKKHTPIVKKPKTTVVSGMGAVINLNYGYPPRLKEGFPQYGDYDYLRVKSVNNLK